MIFFLMFWMMGVGALLGLVVTLLLLGVPTKSRKVQP
jgi:hypothetical protein